MRDPAVERALADDPFSERWCEDRPARCQSCSAQLVGRSHRAVQHGKLVGTPRRTILVVTCTAQYCIAQAERIAHERIGGDGFFGVDRTVGAPPLIYGRRRIADSVVEMRIAPSYAFDGKLPGGDLS